MSVYTAVLPHELTEFLDNYSLGQLEQFVGISDGIENTNYFVTTNQGGYVLTILEVLKKEEAPYFLGLMAHLAENNIPSAHPVADNNGNYLQQLKGKPAAIVQRLKGASVDIPTVQQCIEIGTVMAKMHLACDSFSLHRQPARGADWRQSTAERVMSRLGSTDAKVLQAEVNYHAKCPLSGMPAGVIHADLFRDNVLFVGNTLTGIIDFYYAFNGPFIYDLAVVVNDWCTTDDSSHDKTNAKNILSAYGYERQLTEQEMQAWPTALRAAALRFWLSRLQDKYFPRSGEITHIKDPNVFKRILLDRVKQVGSSKEMWS